MCLEPSPILRRPPEVAPPRLDVEPTQDLWIDLEGLTQASVTGLSHRMGRPGGWQGWWCKHFGPKKGADNEVLGHARSIGARLASAFLGVDPRHREFVPAQLELLVHRCVNRAFLGCSYPARKEWARRVAGRGVGDFHRARQVLDREAGPLPMTLGGAGAAPDVRQLQAQFAKAVLRALVGAPRQS